MKTKITAPGVFSPSSLFSHAIAVDQGQLVFLSGCLARDPASGKVGPIGDIVAQATVCFENIGKILGAAGGSLKDTVKMTVFLKNPSDYAAFNDVRRKMLTETDYASSTVIASLVDPDALVEIEVVAMVQARP